VGKTWVGVALATALAQHGMSVAARKPAQSYASDEIGTTDAELLAQATGASPTTVCPAHRWYPVPMAPPMAADALDRPSFTVADLVSEIDGSWPTAAVDVGLVETAGGAWSPQASDGGHVGHLANVLEPDVVLLVADAGLGVINAVRASMVAFGPGCPVVVALNRFEANDGLHVANLAWLVQRDGVTAETGVEGLVAIVAPPVNA